MPYFQPKLTLPPTLTFTSKTILITGATAGLGLAATTLLLQHSASEIIFGVRNTAKGSSIASQILSSPLIKKPNPAAKITVLHLDLENYSSVLAFAKEVKEKYDGKLDMLLLNAGTGSLKWEVLASGHEKTMQVNLLSPALLALELFPVLEGTARRTGVQSRISWVGSFVQFDHGLEKHPIPVEFLAGHKNNGNHKSILSHFDNEENFLVQFVDPKMVVINDVSPGMVRTGFGEYPIWLRGMMAVVFGLKARSPEEGAKTYLRALGVAGSESHGRYLSDNKVAERAPITKTPAGKEIQEKLWDDMWKEFLNLDAKLEPLERQIL